MVPVGSVATMRNQTAPVSRASDTIYTQPRKFLAALHRESLPVPQCRVWRSSRKRFSRLGSPLNGLILPISKNCRTRRQR